MEKINILTLLVIFAFLLSYFEPELILEDTTITGGDTASHYAYAKYMKDHLLPGGKISGWYPGAFSGFPVFVFYFFPPFLLSVIMGEFIPLKIAFKIVTLLGIFSLPLSVFLSFRLMRFKFPTPIIAAVFTLPFLFMEANSMWGGNIPSTLAGEFSYSISLSLAVLFIGLLFRRVEDKRSKKTLAPQILLFFVVLTHVYTMMVVVLGSLFFLLTRDRERSLRNFIFLLWVYLTTFLLVGFWVLPLVANLGYTTPYAHAWDIKGITEVFPSIFYPFYIFWFFGLLFSWKQREMRIFYIAFLTLVAFALFLVAPKLGIVDIRFLPFIQLFILLISAYGFSEVTKGLKGQKLIPLIAIVATIIWVNSNVAYIDTWIEWNYEGYENKPLWGAYSGVNEFLKGDAGDPRVVYEHSELHNSAGSSRAFESLPLFSGRSTLEGVYMQSSISSPYVFLIQSEVSLAPSCPFPEWPCGRLNLSSAARHMGVFNAGQIVAVSGEVKGALSRDKNFRLSASFPPYEVYDLITNEGRYVTVPELEPVQLLTDSFKEDFYLWFLSGDVPLVYEPKGILPLQSDSLADVPKVGIENNCTISEEIKNEEILINTDCVGLPHIIKVSYFPNWKVEGAKKIYLVSPSFMLIYPEKESVRLYYGRTTPDYLGFVFSLAGIFLILFEGRVRGRADKYIIAGSRYLPALAVIGILALFAISLSGDETGRDSFAMDVSVSLKNYVLCDTIKSSALREECFRDVGIATYDYNLCDVKITGAAARDECFKKIGLATRDYNLCSTKISDQNVKDECLEGLK